MNSKILSRLIDQFQQRHRRLPEKILIDPLAAVVLAARRSLAPKWRGIPLEFVELDLSKVSETPTALGVSVIGNEIRAVDLK